MWDVQVAWSQVLGSAQNSRSQKRKGWAKGHLNLYQSRILNLQQGQWKTLSWWKRKNPRSKIEANKASKLVVTKDESGQVHFDKNHHFDGRWTARHRFTVGSIMLISQTKSNNAKEFPQAQRQNENVQAKNFFV